MEQFSDHGIFVPAHASGEVDVICPKCSHTRKKSKDKCLSVNTVEGTWHCHHCSWSGGLRSDVRWHERKTAKKEYVKPNYKYSEFQDQELYEWFASRGISRETVDAEHITLQDGWVKFPYYKNGEVVNVKSRRLREKQFFQEKDAERVLYGMVPVPEGEEMPEALIWVEGEMDRLALIEAGHKYVVSVPDGAPSPGSKGGAKLDFFQTCEDYISQFKEHVIAVDSDAPGQALRDELARRLGIERCKRVTWSDECKDANDVLMKHGKHELRDCIAFARYFPFDGIAEVRDILSDAIRLYDEGITRGVGTGWESVDKYLTIRPGELCVLTGTPGHGKSSWLDALAISLAEREGWRIGVFSPENAPLSQHFKKLAECYIGKSYLPGQSDRMKPSDVVEAARFLQEHFFFISPGDSAFTIDDILQRAKVLVYRYGINFLIVDPFNDVDLSNIRDENETGRISLFLSKCQRFARMHKVFFCLVAHPTKLRRDEKTGRWPVPTPNDIAGSAHFRNRADICLCVYRPDDTKDFIELHVQKVRFKEVGHVGMTRLDYSKTSGRFFEHVTSFARTKSSVRIGAAESDRELAEARSYEG